MKWISQIWDRLFLVERPSLSLCLFRVAVALTTGFHVIPTLCHLQDNYFPTAFKTFNTNFFTIGVIEWVQKSPEPLIVAMVIVFCVSCFTLLIGFLSQISCIVMTLACYYFYALNAFHVGTLSWDILLVTLFLMCLTSYHGDYFSVDCLIRGGEEAYKRLRPYYLQRLLQLQLAFTFFYTALYKTTAQGNCITSNPIYFLMNGPPTGVTKMFLLRDFMMDKPDLCYAIGISIVVLEYLMIFLLFYPKTRISAIYLGILFHIMLILTLDVPAIFFFLFPAQFLLFIRPDHIVNWIDQKRAANSQCKRAKLIYDGQCRFCRSSVEKLKIFDLYATLEFVDLHTCWNLQDIHPNLTKEKAMSQLHLIEPSGQIFGGFTVFRRLCFTCPMMYPLILIFFFPGMGIIGPLVYKFVANNRYLFHLNPTCNNNSCFRK